ncbi:AAA family ATPase [Azospirillum sp. sgz302134]
MRILFLRLPKYKNFNDFEIRFSPSEPDVLIVGNNGSGKSNLMEALVTIFRDLIAASERKAPIATPFAYQIEYKIQENLVEVDHDPQRSRARTAIKVNGKASSLTALSPPEGDQFLPKTVFAYYSGPSDRLSNLFDSSLADFRNSMIEGDISAHQRLIYGRLIHSRFVLLAFLIDDDPEAFNVLAKELGVQDLESALFVLQQPYWAKPQPVTRKSEFWKAKGVVRKFLARLYAESLGPLQLDIRQRTGIKTYVRRQRLHLFIRNAKVLQDVVDSLRPKSEPRSRILFRLLESAFVSDLIKDVVVKIKKIDTGDGIGFRELSEGEQQLLMVLGLLRFCRDEESLFLLDEPDTHLNPVWGLKFLEMVNLVVGKDATRHLIFVTHDPVAVAMANRDQVRLLAKQEDGKVRSHEPLDDPIKIGIPGVLTSELFGLPSVMAPVVADDITRKHELIALGAQRTSKDSEELVRVEKRLREVDMSSTLPDPLYAEFVSKILERESKLFQNNERLSPNEVAERDAIMNSVIDELFGEIN